LWRKREFEYKGETAIPEDAWAEKGHGMNAWWLGRWGIEEGRPGGNCHGDYGSKKRAKQNT